VLNIPRRASENQRWPLLGTRQCSLVASLQNPLLPVQALELTTRVTVPSPRYTPGFPASSEFRLALANDGHVTDNEKKPSELNLSNVFLHHHENEDSAYSLQLNFGAGISIDETKRRDATACQR